MLVVLSHVCEGLTAFLAGHTVAHACNMARLYRSRVHPCICERVLGTGWQEQDLPQGTPSHGIGSAGAGLLSPGRLSNLIETSTTTGRWNIRDRDKGQVTPGVGKASLRCGMCFARENVINLCASTRRRKESPSLRSLLLPRV